MKFGCSSPLREYDISVIDDVLCIFDGQGREYKYDPTDALSQSIQKTLFNEKRIIIENCLFGVDINPNAVAICQLRLWIELLKNAYYENGKMETLPNIDINIKCGNSLIHKLSFSVGKKIGSQNFDIEKSILMNYKNAIKLYHRESDKAKKVQVKQTIEALKTRLHDNCSQLKWDLEKTGDLSVIDTAEWSLDRYEDAFEWAIEFPEIITDDGTFIGFDCIIGNPPYIRVQELKHEDIDYYKHYYQTAWKRIDISTLFIELGYELIHQDGLVSYITSNQFLTTEYGRRIRSFIYQNHFVNKMVDFADLPVFDGALTYVSIFFFKKNRLNRSLTYFHVLDLPFVVPSEEQWGKIMYSELDEEESWNLERVLYSSVFDCITSKKPEPLTKYAKPHYGIVSGKDEVLIFDIDQEVPIENDVLLPVIRAQGCSRYGKAEPNKKVIYPYKKVGNQTILLTADEIKTSYPKLYDYLMNYETVLRNRKDSRSNYTSRDDWFGLVRFGQLRVFQTQKIVTPGEVKHNKFCIDDTRSGFTGARVFCVSVVDEKIDIKYLLALLNSKVVEFYLHHIAPRKAGGYYSYSSQVLEKIPIIIDTDQKPYVSLVEEIMDCLSQGISSKALEDTLDDMVYALYGIGTEERNLIEKVLSD